jgi:putative transposase
MRYPAAEKLEIIRLVEQSHFSVQQTLARIGVPRTTFYRWYDRYIEHGPEGLEDRPSRPSRVWNRIPDAVRDQIVELALEESDLSPRELAVRFSDTKKYFVSEASVYRLLKSYDLITSPAFVVIKAAEEFKDKTTAPNQMWQTDFTYLKVTGWGWFYLSTVLDDFSRYIVGWKLCTNMGADDVSATLDIALAASGCDTVTVLHKPRLLSDNGPIGATSRAISPNTSKKTAWITSAVRPITPRRRARSSAGTRPSRTASSWKTTTWRASLRPQSSPSSITTTTTGITRASAT